MGFVTKLQDNSPKKIFLILFSFLIIISLFLYVFLIRQKTSTQSGAAGESSLETEQGIISGDVAVLSDTSASEGKYVLFNSPPTSTPYPTGAPAKAELWVQDNNQNTAGGMPNDALEMYTTNKSGWERSRNFISVYMYRINTLTNEESGYTDSYLQSSMLPFLKSSNIRFALNVPGATWAQCGNRSSIMFREEEFIRKIEELGGKVEYLSLQSVMSKPSEECPQYSYEQRIEDVVRYSKHMKNKFPGIKVGLYDAMVAQNKPYKTVYLDLVNELTKEGLKLDYIHLDFPMEYANANWNNALEAEKFIRNRLNVTYGITMTSSEGGDTSAQVFYKNVLKASAAYKAAGGRPDNILVTSWFTHPRRNLTETSTEPYTLMKTVLDLSLTGVVVK